MNIRDAVKSDLEQIVNLHLKSFHENELSIFLGRFAIEVYWDFLIQDPNARIIVLETSKSKIVGLSCCISNFKNTENHIVKRLRKKILGKFLKSLVTGDFSRIVSAFKRFLSPSPVRLVPEKIYDFLVGINILDKSYRNDLVITRNFIKIYRDNIEFLIKKSVCGVWSACRGSNRESRDMFRRHGFSHIGFLDSYPEKISVCIKPKDNNS